jgi:hypothetical protein
MNRREVLLALSALPAACAKSIGPTGRVSLGMAAASLTPPWRLVGAELSVLGGPATLLYLDGKTGLPITLADKNSAAIAQIKDGRVSALTVLPNGPGLTVDQLIAFSRRFEAWFLARGFYRTPDAAKLFVTDSNPVARPPRPATWDGVAAILKDEALGASEVELVSLARGPMLAGIAANNGRRRDAHRNHQPVTADNGPHWRMQINLNGFVESGAA